MILLLIIATCSILVAYCVLFLRDVAGASTPREELRFVYKTYTILLYRRIVTYELIVKSYVDCSIMYRVPDIPVWNPRLALYIVSELNILDTPALMDLSRAFEAKKFSVF